MMYVIVSGCLEASADCVFGHLQLNCYSNIYGLNLFMKHLTHLNIAPVTNTLIIQPQNLHVQNIIRSISI